MIKFIFTQMSKELVGKSKKVALEVSNKKMRERTPLSMPSESTVKFKLDMCKIEIRLLQ